MKMFATRSLHAALIAAALIAAPRPSMAHFLWITLEPSIPAADGRTTIRVFLSETPAPEGPEMLKVVRDVKPTVDGQPVPTMTGEETIDAHWVGKPPAMVDAAKDLGIKVRDGKSYRLFYSARAQTAPVLAVAREDQDKLRVRLVSVDGKDRLQVLFDGKPVAKARLKVYPETGDATEGAADDQGLATVAGLADGKTAVWANWVDAIPGEANGKTFAETRYYATLTVQPRSKHAPTASGETAPTAFATMTAPAVNSFGGAVLGDWLYIYSGHVGRTHEYDVNATSRNFRRLNLKDRTTWEELPMSRDVQGVALVSDGKFVYRLGGMSARNQPGEDHDLVSVADFARFDPSAKTWIDLAPLPQPRSTHDAVVLGRTVFAVGGWEMKGATEKASYVDHAAAFDLDHPEQGWRKVEQPFRRRALSVGEVDGKLYVLGGLNDAFKVERRLDIYDPATKGWTTGPDLPGSGRNDGFGTSAFGVDGRLYFSGVAGRIFRLDAKNGVWEALGAWSIPRITHRLLPGPDHTLLAVGGNNKGQQIPTIESVALARPAAPTGAGGE